MNGACTYLKGVFRLRPLATDASTYAQHPPETTACMHGAAPEPEIYVQYSSTDLTVRAAVRRRVARDEIELILLPVVYERLRAGRALSPVFGRAAGPLPAWPCCCWVWDCWLLGWRPKQQKTGNARPETTTWQPTTKKNPMTKNNTGAPMMPYVMLFPKATCMNRNDHTTLTAPLPVCSAKLSNVGPG